MSNAFADKDENPELPGSDWEYNFSEQNGKTKVSITIYNESLARLEKMIEMGFKEGMSEQLNNLDDLLATLSQRSWAKPKYRKKTAADISHASGSACP